ncbi:hypothetical protein Tco_0868740 [Tanacetum coccineum]
MKTKKTCSQSIQNSYSFLDVALSDRLQSRSLNVNHMEVVTPTAHSSNQCRAIENLEELELHFVLLINSDSKISTPTSQPKYYYHAPVRTSSSSVRKAIPEWHSPSSTEPEPESARHIGDQAVQNHMIQHALKGMNDNNNRGAKPSISGQSGGGLTRSDSFTGGSHSNSCAGGEKAVDLPHVSDIFQDIVSSFTENGFFDNDEPFCFLRNIRFNLKGQSGGRLTSSDSFKGGLNSDSCAGGEKAIDLPHVSDIFLDIVSDLTENGFFYNDEPGWKFRMAASSSTAPFSLDLYHNGYFKLKPLTYIDSEMVTINIDVTGFKFEDMKEYVETKTHSLVTGLYYFNKGLNNIKCDAVFTVFVENWQSNEDKMAQLYVDHRNADLGEYIGKDLGDNILVELKPGYDFNDSNDEFSNVASLDHLSEGEEELREVRIKKSVEEKNKSNGDVDDENRLVLHNKDVYDESRLVLHNDNDDNDHEVDPLFSNLDDDSLKEKVHVEPKVNSDDDMPIMDEDEIVYDPNKRDYPIHDPNIHWKLKKPILGELYADLDQVKDCLTFYSVANGY